MAHDRIVRIAGDAFADAGIEDLYLNTVIYFDLGDTLIYGPSNNRQPYSDAVATLSKLYEAGYLIGLLSNQATGTSVADVRARLVTYGLSDFIDVITISSEHPDGNVFKPDPRIFELALQKAGRTVASQKTIFVTETESHITAARNLGWRAILKRNSGACATADGECVTGLSPLLNVLPGPRDTAGKDTHYAPPARVVDGILAVPQEIQNLAATLVFDAATGIGQVDATIDFTVGSTDGNPLFDLRQTIDSAWLDGNPIGIDRLAHYDLGGGTDARLRVIEADLAAGSNHTLRLAYQLSLPDALNSGSGPPTYAWNGERLTLKFWYTDLRAGRYQDAWLPGNLIFDRFPTVLDIEIVNSSIAHTVITNGALTEVGDDHWQVSFPLFFSVCSSMLRIHPTDEIVEHVDSVSLLSGNTINLHLFKPSGSSLDLTAQVTPISDMLDNFETSTGRYPHGDRFTVFFEGSGGMEYAGATKTSVLALEHETFHSWWGRGAQPATQCHSWIDEAWTQYNTGFGAFRVEPFDMSDPPLTLCSPNAFSRITPNAAYTNGSDFFGGLAAVIGLNNLRAYMSNFYEGHVRELMTTPALESFLICKSGVIEIADYFDRFVYGFDDTNGTPNFRITQLWSQQDDASVRGWEQVEAGQDNWFYAEITNASTTATARAAVVSFSFKSPFATPVYPGDFRDNIISAAVEFNIAPGETRTVKARWPRELIPAIPTGADRRHGCILAEIYNPEDHVAAGVTSIGASAGKLKQRNTDIVDLLPDETTDYFFDTSSRYLQIQEFARLEVIRPARLQNMEISFHHRNPAVVRRLMENVAVIKAKVAKPLEPVLRSRTEVNVLDPTRVSIYRGAELPLVFHLAAGSSLMVPDQSASSTDVDDGIDEAFARCDADLAESGDRASLRLHPGRRVGLPVVMKPRQNARMRIRLRAPRDAKPGESFTVQVKQRNRRGEIIGEFDVLINVVDRK